MKKLCTVEQNAMHQISEQINENIHLWSGKGLGRCLHFISTYNLESYRRRWSPTDLTRDRFERSHIMVDPARVLETPAGALQTEALEDRHDRFDRDIVIIHCTENH
jgi:hypothetical protein